MKFNVILFKHDIREYRGVRMAENLKITHQTFSARMKNPRRMRIDDYERICEFLGKKPDYYFTNQ